MQVNPSFFISQPGWVRAEPYLYLIYFFFKSDYISHFLYTNSHQGNDFIYTIICATTKELILLLLSSGKGLGCLCTQFPFISKCDSSTALKLKHWINNETIFWFSDLSSLSLAKIPVGENCWAQQFIFTFGVLLFIIYYTSHIVIGNVVVFFSSQQNLFLW